MGIYRMFKWFVHFSLNTSRLGLWPSCRQRLKVYRYYVLYQFPSPYPYAPYPDGYCKLEYTPERRDAILLGGPLPLDFPVPFSHMFLCPKIHDKRPIRPHGALFKARLCRALQLSAPHSPGKLESPQSLGN